ncbi:MAG: DUF1993 domain-containing protein [Pseudomonadota bacterium]
MTFNIRDASTPVYKRGLRTLLTLLDRAETHAQANGVDINTLLGAKLAPDMFDFKKQVQIATDHAKGGAARLAGLEPPTFLDQETTIAELRIRVQAILDYVDGIEEKLYAGAEDRDIRLVYPWATYEFKGAKFLTYWSLPNFFFHLTTAYDILRAQGVPIGKADFLGK